MQSSKKTKIVRDPNLGIKMSDFHIFANKSQIRMFFLIKMGVKLLFIDLRSITIKFCFIFSKKTSQISINESYFWFQPKMSGFLQNNVRDPRSQNPDFLELCCNTDPYTVTDRDPVVDFSLFRMVHHIES